MDMTGRTVIVTGASSGLGQVVARELQRRGAHVIAAVRNPARAAGFDARALDLADLDSVRAFAAGVDEDVDVLVNNAGVGNQPRRLSPQGFESTFATNFLGHFALTGLLLGRLRDDGRARVVHVSSALYRYMKSLPLDDLAAERGYAKGRAYVGSKLAQLVFGLELDRRLRAAGRPIGSLVAHPGMANTPMNANLPSRSSRAVMRVLRATVGRPAERAAIPIVYAAADPAARPGVFIGPHARKWDDRVYADPIAPHAADPALAARLWTIAEEATGVRFALDGAHRA